MKKIIIILLAIIPVIGYSQKSTFQYNGHIDSTALRTNMYTYKAKKDGHFYPKNDSISKYTFRAYEPVISESKIFSFANNSKPIYFVTPKDSIVVFDSIKFNSLIKYVHTK